MLFRSLGLQKKKIPYYVHQDVELFDQRSVKIMVNLANTICDPLNSSALFQLLIGGFFKKVDRHEIITLSAQAKRLNLPLEEASAPPSAEGPIPDVLTMLAQERAEKRGFDVTVPRRWTVSPATIVLSVIMLLTAGIAVDAVLTDETPAGPLAYDCGLHPDREAVDVLLARIDRTLPTQVTAESGHLRLRVGPFDSRAAAESARAQVWLLGACRVIPGRYPEAISPDRTAGG